MKSFPMHLVTAVICLAAGIMSTQAVEPAPRAIGEIGKGDKKKP